MSLFDLDRDVFRAIHLGWRSEALDPWFRFITNSGLGEWQVAALIPFIIIKSTRRAVLTGGLAAILTALLRVPTMQAIGRMRPSNFEWAVPMENVYSHTSSFPSGHTTGSFAIAVGIWSALDEKSPKWIGPLLLLWAIAVGISRIYVGVHYPTDILGGALFGSLGGYLFSQLLMTQFSFFRPRIVRRVKDE